jgi:hypothetical protein
MVSRGNKRRDTICVTFYLGNGVVEKLCGREELSG